MSDLVREFFQLNRHPFTTEIDVEGLYPFLSFQQGILRLDQALYQRSSVLIVGEVGSGKTALIRAFTKRLAPSSFEIRNQLVMAAQKNAARATVDGFLTGFGEPIPFNNMARSLEALKHCLHRLHEQGRQPILLLDDVHHLKPSDWLTLKALMNFELDSKISVLLIFMGAEEDTLRTLALNSLQEVRDRLGLCYHLRGLKVNEVEKYLTQRLRWAGAGNPLFPADIAEQIWRHSQGIPRRINRLAGACLLAAASNKKDLIDQTCLVQALSETQFQAPPREEE